jgi:Bacterial PH domain
MTTQVFDVPDAGGSGWLVLLVFIPTLILIGTGALFWPRPLRVEVTAGSVAIRGSIYGRSVPRSELMLEQARVVDLEREPALKPLLRTNGVGLPNYRVGWFRLRDRERALCFLTRTDRVVYLPTTQNYAILVSAENPTALLTALRTN